MQPVNSTHLNTNDSGPTTSHESLYSSSFSKALATPMDSLGTSKTLFDSEYLTFTSSELQNGQLMPANFAQGKEMPTKFITVCLLAMTGPVFEETIEDKIIQSLVYVELKVRKIRESACWPSSSQSIRELLESHNKNLLAHADLFPKEQKWPLPIDEALRSEANERRPRWLMLDMFLCIEMEALLKHMTLTNTLLLESFYSWQMKSETISMPNGYLPIKLQFLPTDVGLKRIMDKMKLLTCQTMTEMTRIQMTMEEFALLKAVIYSHSAIHGLSVRGRILLEKESIRYAKTLMKHLQTRLGAAPGAKKYADIVSFVSCLFHGAQNLRQMHIYISTAAPATVSVPPYMETIMYA
ncbi:hypothetical protein Ddc_12303 [Ditylenchus destructor]|nr:hypothetical protein Ddc_12303 [Ditylenchus destructor]